MADAGKRVILANKSTQEQRLIDDNGRLLGRYWRNCLSDEQQQALWPQLLALPWQRPQVKVFGKHHLIPRQQCYLGQSGCAYRYSGLLLQPNRLPNSLTALMEQLNQQHNWQFNAVLANHYRDGADKMGWHRDNEPELGAEPDLAIISLGATRTLRLRWDKGSSVGVALESGSLLWLPGLVYHSLGACKLSEPRISLTFRNVIPHFHQATR